MTLFLKHAAITLFVIVGFLASIIAPVAWMSQSMSSNPNDDTGKMLSFSALCIFAVCALMILLLSGCSTTKALIDACRDGLCR